MPSKKLPKKTSAPKKESKDKFKRIHELERKQVLRDLHLIPPGMETRWRNLIIFIDSIVDALFPGVWDFSMVENLDYVKGDFGVLTMYHPTVTITSRKDLPYEITDLYVRVYFNSECNIMGKLYGTRSALRDIEFVSQYCHSHLKGTSINGFAPFCQGATFMRDLLTKLSAQGVLDSKGSPN